MDEEVGIKNERVDDVPLLLAQMERMGIQPLLDSCFPHARKTEDRQLIYHR